MENNKCQIALSIVSEIVSLTFLIKMLAACSLILILDPNSIRICNHYREDI